MAWHDSALGSPRLAFLGLADEFWEIAGAGRLFGGTRNQMGRRRATGIIGINRKE
jgi:hypothetical protein